MSHSRRYIVIKASRRILTALYLICLLASCKSSKSISADGHEGEPANAKLAFVTIKVSADSMNNEHFEMVGILFSDGELRENQRSNSGDFEGLICEFLDQDHTLLSKVKVTNPLRTPVEVFSEDGTIEKVIPTLNEAMITFRAMISPSAAFIQIKNQSGEVLSLMSLK